MQNQFQPEENQTPQTASLPAAQTAPVTETEAELRAALRVTQRLNEITERANGASFEFWTGFVGWCICFALCAFLLAPALAPNGYALCLLASLLLIVPIIALPMGDWLRSRTLPKFDAGEIAKLGGMQAIPSLLATLRVTQSGKQRRAIVTALTALLPQLKASDAPLITADARRVLHSLLQTAFFVNISDVRTYDLTIAALKALEQVGDAQALPYVRRLANRKPRTLNGKRLQQAAADCLPMLRAHCGDVETARILLRASQPATTDPKTLLRPASGAGQTDNAELLRETDAPETQE